MNLSKKLISLATTTSIFLLSNINLGYAENTVPDIYKFIPENNLITVNLDTKPESWNTLLKDSKTMQNALKELLEDKESWFSYMLEKYPNEAIGESLIGSLIDIGNIFDLEKEKEVKLPSLVFVEKFSDNTKSELFKARLKEFFKEKTDFKLIESKIKNIDIMTFENTMDESSEFNNFAFVDNYVLFGLNKEALEKSLNAFDSTTISLKASENFAKEYEKVGSNYKAQFYLDSQNVISLIKKLPNKKDFNEFFALSKGNKFFESKSFLLNFDITPKSLLFKSYTRNNGVKASASQINKASDFKDFMSYSPKNTLFFLGYSDLKNVGTSLKTNLELLENFDKPKNTKNKALKSQAFLTSMNTVLGLNILDFADNLKENFAISGFYSDTDTFIPSIALFLTPINKNEMQQSLNKMTVDLTDIMADAEKGNRSKKETKKTPKVLVKFTETKKYKDLDIHVTNEVKDLSAFGVRPAYTTFNDYIVIASNEDALKSIIDRKDSNSSDFSLNGSENFQAVKNYLTETSNVIAYINPSAFSKLLGMIKNSGDKIKEDDKMFFSIVENLKAFAVNSYEDKDGELSNVLLLANLDKLNMDKALAILDAPDSNFNKAQNRAKISSAKANAHTLQTLLETHGVDWRGQYPPSLKELEKEAKKYSYWKDFKNPFTKKQGIAINGALLDYANYKKVKDVASMKGLVLYKAENCAYVKAEKRTFCTNYKIYALDEKGNMIKDKNKQFVLSNI